MILKDITLPSPEENVLYDELLLRQAEGGLGEEALRFWESPLPFIVLGRISRYEDDVDRRALARYPIPMVRRCSGGGTVLQGRGCLNYALVLSKLKNKHLQDIHGSYEFILNKIITGLNDLGVKAVFRPVSDIALMESEKKFSGNAQKRGRQFILHHGTILYNFDLSCIAKYLRIPKSFPEYRRGRGHLEFVTNVDVSASLLKEKLREIFDAQPESRELLPEEREQLQRLSAERRVFRGL